MVISRAFIGLAVALLLGGCGYREAMQRADAAEARRDWAAAAAEYEAALQHDPEDEVAARRLADAQRRWHAQSLSRFEKALSEGDLPAAHEALRQAESARPAAPANTIAAGRLTTAEAARRADALRVRARALETQDKIQAALQIWAEAQGVHATTAGEAALARSRAAVLAQAGTAEAAGRWVDADQAWAAIAASDPQGPAARIAGRARWAAAWRAEAVDHAAAGRIGPALVRSAQVAAISADPADRARRDTLRAELTAAYALRPQVQLTGPSARTAAIEARLPKPITLDPASPVLALRGALAPARFTQSKTVKVRAARYQDGTLTERNPRWIIERDAVRDARRRRDAAEKAVSEAERGASQIDRTLEEARRQRADDTRRERRRLRRALKQAREEEQRCQSAARDATDSSRASARGRLDRAQRSVDDAWRALDALADRDDAGVDDHAAERAQSRLDSAREDLDRARRAEADAERALDRVEPTIQTPRYETQRFAVEAWTRSAEGALILEVALPALAGEAQPPESVPLTAGASTQDQRHAAQVRLGLDADPLRFPDADSALVQAVDQRLGDAVAKAIAAQEARWARALLTRAMAASTPAEQARFAAAAVLVRGASPDTTSRALDVLTRRFDLRDLAILMAR